MAVVGSAEVVDGVNARDVVGDAVALGKGRLDGSCGFRLAYVAVVGNTEQSFDAGPTMERAAAEVPPTFEVEKGVGVEVGNRMVEVVGLKTSRVDRVAEMIVTGRAALTGMAWIE